MLTDASASRRRSIAGILLLGGRSGGTTAQDKDDTLQGPTDKGKKRHSIFGTLHYGNSHEPDYGTISTPPKPMRPRPLLKGQRPTSLLGSLRSLTSVENEDKLHNSFSKADSKAGSAEVAERPSDGDGWVILHHGEVQLSGGVCRRRTEYLVLTDTQLLRFKCQARASEVFPSSVLHLLLIYFAKDIC